MLRLIGVDHLDRQRMDAGLEFHGKLVHHRAMLRDAVLTGKLVGRNPDAKMGLAALAPTSVPLMP